MKKRFGALFIMMAMCLCMLSPNMDVQAATGSTSIAVSSGTIDIGDTVTVTAKVTTSSGGNAIATMAINYNASILEFVSCNASVYAGGGGTITATTDTFSITLKAIAAGKAAVSLSATDGIDFDANAELDSVSGSSTNITVNNAAGTNTGTTGSTGTTAGSADNSLKTLTISPGTLSPTFKGSTVNYSATVANDVTNIAVSATPVNANATVESVTGNSNLAVGSNTISIVVKAENGTTATYKITVTRQAAGESGTTTTTETPAEEPEEPEVPEVSGEVVSVNNMSYYIASSFAEELIPADFSQTSVMYHEVEYSGLSFNQGEMTLLYLVPADATDSAGRFFVYDETRDSFYDFIKMTAGANYVLALLAPIDYTMPENYHQTTVTTTDGATMNVYQQIDEEAEEASEFYLFYGVNNEGTENWYQYDSVEGTYQRYSGEISSEETASSADLAYLQESYTDLSNRYKTEKANSRNVIAGLIFAIAVLLIVILNIVLYNIRKKKQPDDIFDDDDDFHDDDPDDSVGKRKLWKKGKSEETSDTNESDELDDADITDSKKEKKIKFPVWKELDEIEESEAEEPEAKAEPESDFKTTSESETKPEIESKTKSEAESEPKTKPESEPESKTAPDSETEPKSEQESETKSKKIDIFSEDFEIQLEEEPIEEKKEPKEEPKQEPEQDEIKTKKALKQTEELKPKEKIEHKKELKQTEESQHKEPEKIKNIEVFDLNDL